MIKPSSKIANLFRELIRYGAVSTVALAVDFCVLMMLAKHIHYLTAACLSFTLGGLVAYWLSIKFVFTQRALRHASAELGLFIALGIVGLGINAAVIGIAVGQWSLNLGISKTLAAGGTFTCNFALRKWLLFSRGTSHTAANAVPSL